MKFDSFVQNLSRLNNFYKTKIYFFRNFIENTKKCKKSSKNIFLKKVENERVSDSVGQIPEKYPAGIYHQRGDRQKISKCEIWSIWNLCRKNWAKVSWRNFNFFDQKIREFWGKNRGSKIWPLKWFFRTATFISFESLGMKKFASIRVFNYSTKNSFLIDINWRYLKF